MSKVKYIGIVNNYYNEQLLYANKYLMFSNIMIYDVNNDLIIPETKYFPNYFKTKFTDTDTDNTVSLIESHIISKIGNELTEESNFPNVYVSQSEITFKHFFIMRFLEIDIDQISTINIHLSDNATYNSEIGYYSLVLFNDTNTLYNQLLTKTVVDNMISFNINEQTSVETNITSIHYKSLIDINISNYYEVKKDTNTIEYIMNQNVDLQYYKNLNKMLLYEIQKINDDNDKLRYSNSKLISDNSRLQNSVTSYTNQITKLSNDKNNLIIDITRLVNMNMVLDEQNKDILGNIIDNINQLFSTNPIDISNPDNPEEPIDPNQPIIF